MCRRPSQEFGHCTSLFPRRRQRSVSKGKMHVRGVQKPLFLFIKYADSCRLSCKQVNDLIGSIKKNNLTGLAVCFLVKFY